MREIFSAQGKKIQSLGIRVVLPENRSELNEMLPSLINDGVVTVDTNGNIKIIGSMIWVHGSLLDLFMDQGQFYKFIADHTDLLEKK